MDSLFSVNNNQTLILGSNGLLGSFYKVYFERLGCNSSDSKIDFAAQDISIFERYVLEMRPNTILNCSGLVDISLCEEMPELAYYLNSTVPHTLSKLAKSINAALVHVSSPSVFDRGSINHHENDSTSTVNSVYGLSKVLGEKNVLQSNNNAIVCRLNFFGSSERKRTFFGDLIAALQSRSNFSAFSDVFFNPLFGGDLPGIISQLLKQGRKGLYHVVGNECVSKLHFSRLTERLMGFQTSHIQEVVSWGEFSTGLRSRNTCLSNKKLKSDGIVVPTLIKSISNSLAFYKIS